MAEEHRLEVVLRHTGGRGRADAALCSRVGSPTGNGDPSAAAASVADSHPTHSTSAAPARISASSPHARSSSIEPVLSTVARGRPERVRRRSTSSVRTPCRARATAAASPPGRLRRSARAPRSSALLASRSIPSDAPSSVGQCVFETTSCQAEYARPRGDTEVRAAPAGGGGGRDAPAHPRRGRTRASARRPPSASTWTGSPGWRASPGRRCTSCSARAPGCSTRSATICCGAARTSACSRPSSIPDARETLRARDPRGRRHVRGGPRRRACAALHGGPRRGCRGRGDPAHRGAAHARDGAARAAPRRAGPAPPGRHRRGRRRIFSGCSPASTRSTSSTPVAASPPRTRRGSSS